jgi:hypothetical protein
MEVMCLLNSKPIIKMSSDVTYLPNSMPESRILTIRRVHEIEIDPDNPYYPDSIEKYFNRPQDAIFHTLSYPEYFSQFIIEKRKRQSHQEHESHPNSFKFWRDDLQNYVYRRQRRQITRSPFRHLADGEPFFYSLLLEKRSWRSEQQILGDHLSYRDHFMSLYPDEYRDIINQQ